MKIHRKFFYDTVRQTLFDGVLAQQQVDGMNKVLTYAESIDLDGRQLSYLLATSHHETAFTHQPIEEYGKGAGKSYGVPDPATGETYYGRGLVQLTWKTNYEKMDAKFDLHGKLVQNADLALDPELAVKILVQGCLDGDFTGVSLHDYVECTNYEDDKTDFYHARKVVNALDCADKIASYAESFAAAIIHTTP